MTREAPDPPGRTAPRQILARKAPQPVTNSVKSRTVGEQNSLRGMSLRPATELAARLHFHEASKGTSTSSFRPPGGPTPSRGFFLPRISVSDLPARGPPSR